MQYDTILSKDKHLSTEAEKDREFQSVEEYLSYIATKETRIIINTEKLSFYSKNGVDWKDEVIDKHVEEKDFIAFLKCYDHYLDFLNLKFPEVDNLNKFYRHLDESVSQVGIYNFKFDKDSKVLRVADLEFNKISKSIMDINMYQVMESKKHLSLQVWSYLMYACQKVYYRATCSMAYGHFLDMHADYCMDMCYEYNAEEEIDEVRYYERMANSIDKLNELTLSFGNYASRKIDRRHKFTDVEKKIIEICDKIINRKDSAYYKYMDDELYEELIIDSMEEHHQEQFQDYGLEYILTTFIDGLYVLSYNENFTMDCELLQAYVDQVNNYEANGEWFAEISCYHSINEDGFIGEEPSPERKMIVDYMNAFTELDEILCQLLTTDSQ